MMGKVMGYVGMTVVVGLLAQMMVTTYYLGKINVGLSDSLDSTKRLIGIQQSIIEKNKALEQVVNTTKEMDTQLVSTLAVTNSIRTNILKINELNGATLQLNRNMEVFAGQSGVSLQAIAKSTGQLQTSTQSLHDSLTKLYRYIDRDRANLQQMKAYTDQMNAKVPGVGR